MELKSPFPYFGGKSTIAAEVWQHFGDVLNYVEPFFGSGAILLARPSAPRLELVNDANAWLTNFWRAVQHDPEAVAYYADYPASELDLHARGDWLFYRADAPEFAKRLRSDPDYYDAKSAGWWVWGQSLWIGSSWGREEDNHSKVARQKLTCSLRGVETIADLPKYFVALAERLRAVRILCGDWSRAVTPTMTEQNGLTAVFLDPPYMWSERDNRLYSSDDNCAAAVRDWAIAHGSNPLYRIALCGYIEEHEIQMPADWSLFRWVAQGGMANTGNGSGKRNRFRECIWFSPHCLVNRLPGM